MQPQDTSWFDWFHVLAAAIGGLFSAVILSARGVWKLSRIEKDIRKDFSQEVAEAVHEFREQHEDLAVKFEETLKAMRQKVNDVELDLQKNFVSKANFAEFRQEYRDDMREIKGAIAAIAARPR